MSYINLLTLTYSCHPFLRVWTYSDFVLFDHSAELFSVSYHVSIVWRFARRILLFQAVTIPVTVISRRAVAFIRQRCSRMELIWISRTVVCHGARRYAIQLAHAREPAIGSSAVYTDTCVIAFMLDMLWCQAGCLLILAFKSFEFMALDSSWWTFISVAYLGCPSILHSKKQHENQENPHLTPSWT